MSANVVSYRKVPTGSFTTTSTTYVDLLDQPAGAVFSVTITKSAGTDILILGGAHFLQSTANNTAHLGVNDGTTDYDLGMNRTFTAVGYLESTGARMITGLGAGTFTFKLRCKQTAVSGSMLSGANTTTFITAIECNSGAVNAAATYVTPTGSAFTFTSTSYTDLLNAAAGSTVSVSITKAQGASTNLIVHGTLSLLGTATADTVTLAVHDGTTDSALARATVDSTPHVQMIGEIALTGLSAGSYTLKLRVKTAGGQTQTFGLGLNSASIAVMELQAP